MRIKRSLLILFNLIAVSYVVFAMSRFCKPVGKTGICIDVKVDVNKGGLGGFLNGDDVVSILKENRIYPKSRSMADVNTREIEKKLGESLYIYNVQCYKTYAGHVYINVKQRVPVVRVMADNGDNYYLDSDCRMYTSGKYSCNVIVATGDISRSFARKHLARIGNHIAYDDFLNNMIEQIHVLPNNCLELIPRIGNQIVYLGAPNNVENKLNRLKKFYKYGLSQIGWTKYSRINVEYENQIICKKTEQNKIEGDDIEGIYSSN